MLQFCPLYECLLPASLSSPVFEAVPQNQSVQHYPLLSMALSDVQLHIPVSGCDKEFNTLYAQLSPLVCEMTSHGSVQQHSRL